jgi:topoisomerase-4 subunit B
VHYNDDPPTKGKEAFIELQNKSTIFITEGDSASGSITKSRSVETQLYLVYAVNRLTVLDLQKRSFMKMKSSIYYNMH